MRHRSPAALAAMLVALSVLVMAGPTAARSPKSEHDRIVAHWTAARMKAAIPRDFVRDSGGRFVPKAKPGGGGGITGASWNKGGAILQRSGKVYFEMGGSGWVCSGAVASDTRTDKSLVLTAGHCAIDETNQEFASYWLFVPDYDGAPTFTCTAAVYGCWTAQALVVHEGFANAGGFNDEAVRHDFAFAVVGNGTVRPGVSNRLETAVGGSFAMTYNLSGSPATVVNGQKLYAFGYPAAGRYKGKDLTYCAGNITQDSLTNNTTWGMACNMTGGSSGGPWLSNFSEQSGSGTLSSLNSYGYSGSAVMYGPKFNNDTLAVYNAANSNGTLTNTIVP